MTDTGELMNAVRVDRFNMIHSWRVKCAQNHEKEDKMFQIGKPQVANKKQAFKNEGGLKMRRVITYLVMAMFLIVMCALSGCTIENPVASTVIGGGNDDDYMATAVQIDDNGWVDTRVDCVDFTISEAAVIEPLPNAGDDKDELVSVKVWPVQMADPNCSK